MRSGAHPHRACPTARSVRDRVPIPARAGSPAARCTTTWSAGRVARLRTGLVLETGEAREVRTTSPLLRLRRRPRSTPTSLPSASRGCAARAWSTIASSSVRNARRRSRDFRRELRKGLEKGLKVHVQDGHLDASSDGYQGAQIFEAVGAVGAGHRLLLRRHRVADQGVGLPTIARARRRRVHAAYPGSRDGGRPDHRAAEPRRATVPVPRPRANSTPTTPESIDHAAARRVKRQEPRPYDQTTPRTS